jgi:hypothetical protein
MTGIIPSIRVALRFKEALIKSTIVIPAEAGMTDKSEPP